MHSEDFWQVLGENRTPFLFRHSTTASILFLIGILLLIMASVKNRHRQQEGERELGHIYFWFVVASGVLVGMGPAILVSASPDLLLWLLGVRPLSSLAPHEVTLVIDSLRSLQYPYTLGFVSAALGTIVVLQSETLMKRLGRLLTRREAAEENN